MGQAGAAELDQRAADRQFVFSTCPARIAKPPAIMIGL